MGDRADQLAAALARLGVAEGDRVGTFMWNNHRHMEAYLAIPSMGAVLHTLNIRLFPEQLAYVVNHAADKVIIIDASLVPRLGCMTSWNRWNTSSCVANPATPAPSRDWATRSTTRNCWRPSGRLLAPIDLASVDGGDFVAGVAGH